MFEPFLDAQPSVPQVCTTHGTVVNHNYNLLNYAAAIRGMGTTAIPSQGRLRQRDSILRNAVYNPSYGYRLLRVQSGNNPALTNVEVSAMVGGVMVTGGGALIAASGTTATTLAVAAATPFILFTAGVALAVAGVALVGYYGYQYLQQQANDAGGVIPPELSIDPHEFEDVL